MVSSYGGGAASGLAGLEAEWAARSAGPKSRKRISKLKIGFFNLPRLWKFVEGDLGGDFSYILLGSSRILEKYNMPCHAMHPIQDLFLDGFSYILQIDILLYALLCGQNFILVKSGCYRALRACQHDRCP
jgi:hypothetical protein